MTKQEPAAQPTLAVSPYLSLRQAVRPLIFTYALLTREQERAGELTEECSRLRQLTQELLKAAALVHLLAPDKSEEVIDGPGDKRSRQIIDAYAKAGLMWAEITGSAIALADALIDSGRWDDVHRFAGFLDAAGEPNAAQDLRARADAAAKRANDARLVQIHTTMTESEIASAIEALQECMDAVAVSFYIRDVAFAILGIAPTSWRHDYSHNFYGHGQYQFIDVFIWDVNPGDWVRKGQVIAHTRIDFGSSGLSEPAEFKIKFPALISKLITANNTKVKGPVVLAEVIEPPEPVSSELDKSEPSIEDISSRLDRLARIFKQIQAENTRR